MRIFYGLIIAVEVTLIALLWLYFFDLYLQDHLDYSSHIFHSDEAIPVIGLGIVLNTVALIFLIRSAAPRTAPPPLPLQGGVNPAHLEKLVQEAEIDDLEKELQRIIGRLEEIKSQPSGKKEG